MKFKSARFLNLNSFQICRKSKAEQKKENKHKKPKQQRKQK
jgi:hypothetical protein